MRKLRIVSLAAAAAALMGVGCATSSQARSVQPSGFLGEYRPLLKSGEYEVEPLQIYKNPKMQFSSYTKALLEPVTIWADPQVQLTPEQQEDLKKLVEAFYATLKQKLAASYEMVEGPGPGTLRIRFALTKGVPANTTFRVASKAAPYSAPANAIWTLATGKPAFVGEASIEYIVQDSTNETLLTAAADRRVGGDAVNQKLFKTWGDVEQALNYWTDAAAYWLCRLRATAKCVAPSASVLPLP